MKKILMPLLIFTSLIITAQTKKIKVPQLEVRQVEEWVNYLASDEMMGRRNGSPEMEIAAKWIADQFKKAGLKEFKQLKGYLQNYYIKRNKTDSIPERNVIGYIEGSDPVLKNEYIALTAHFDHIGFRKGVKPDSIFNGANDNASGTCALIGIANTIKNMKAKPKRTLIFAAVSGEEMGMRGSRFFVANSPVPINSVYLNMNFEMLGHCKVLGEKRYQITGPMMSNLKDFLHAYNKNSEWKLIDTVKNLAGLFYASDNAAFASIKREGNVNYGIPGHTFVTHNGEDHIHKPNDEAKYFDFTNYRNFISYASGLVLYMAGCNEKIEWKDPKFQRIKN